MDKVDLKKELKHLYTAPTGRAVDLDVPPMNYLMIDGRGDPSSSREYRHAVEALFSVSYGLKFSVKKSGGPDYSVMPLEGLWWTEGSEPFTPSSRNNWLWTALIAQPPAVTAPLLASVRDQVSKKKSLPALPLLRFEPLREGKAVQILHLGPYHAEAATIERLHLHIRERGYSHSGKHHEIYLNAPDRTAPEKLKTIIRQPVR